MALIVPVFNLIISASGQTVTKDDWYDLGSFGPDSCSPIPNGKQLWLGYATFISNDKNMSFEIRSNLPTKSSGTIGDTIIRGFSSVLTGESDDKDFYRDGNIQLVCPHSADSTGVEKLWLRTRSSSQSVGTWECMLYYAFI